MKKKVILWGFAALVFASCSKNMDFTPPEGYSQTTKDTDVAKYEDAFVQTFGNPSPTQDWGFGSASGARAYTRAAMPDEPTFRDANPIIKPIVSSAYKNTLAEAIAAGAKYAQTYQNYQKGDIIYVNSNYQTLNNPQNTEDLTIYVDGNVTYCGGTNQNGNGTVFCVTENSTLKLGSVSTNLTVYLAPGATLDITEGLNWDGTPAVDYVWNAEKNANDLVPKKSFTFQNAHAAILMSAGSKLKAYDLNLTNSAKLLNNGGTIEAHNLTMDQACVLWNDGSFYVNSLTLSNTGCGFYNAASRTLSAASVDLNNNNALLYNDGKVSTGAITLHNTDAEVVNNGEIVCSSYSQAAGGKTHNVGVVTMTGKTDLTNSNSSWKNEGQWTCGSFDVDNYSAKNFNNCRLTVNGNFHLNRGTFVLDSNSGVICNSFTWEDTSDFYMGGKSVLKVNGTFLTRNANSGYGLRATGDDYAVIQANEITHEGNEQFRMSYYGKLYVATDNHFAQWYKDAPNTNQPSYWYESTVKFKFNNETTTTIPANACNPGYVGTDGVGGGETITYVKRVMAEDLSATEGTDFDFNDVVFDVAWTATGAKIKLQAAGGTLPLYIGDTNPAHEVHAIFAAANPTLNITVSDMINTRAQNNDSRMGFHRAFNDLDPVEFDLTGDFTDETTGEKNANKIRIFVEKNGKTLELTAVKAQPASKFGCPITTDWADEFQNIDDKWPVKKFTLWVQGGANFWE